MYESSYHFPHSTGTCIQDGCIDCMDMWKGSNTGGLSDQEKWARLGKDVYNTSWEHEDALVVVREPVR